MRPRPLDRRQRYCRDCQGLDRGQSALCPNCGGPWAEPGYCPTCERYWTLPEGGGCPKHGLPLAAEPEAAGSADWSWDEPIDWVTVETFPHPIAAQAARLRLDAEGIPTFLDGERMGDHTIYQNATGGVKLQVPRPLQADARILLAQSWDVPTAADDPEDEEWDEPVRIQEFEQDEPGTLRRPITLVAVGLALLIVALAAWLVGWTSR